MSVSITNIKNKIPSKLYSTTLDRLTGDFYDKCAEAAGNFMAEVRPYTLIRKYVITNAIYDHVYNYVIADDLEPDALIDIRPIGQRSTQDSLQGTSMKQFDTQKEYNTMTIEYINGQKTLRLSKQLSPRTVICEMDSLTMGATVTASDDATNLALDYLDHVSGSASVSFDVTGATGKATITVALSSTIDLSSLERMGAAFVFSKFPLASALTNVKMRIGTSATDYYESTITAAISSAFADDTFQLLMQNLKTATKTGSPNFAALSWVQFEYNYTAGTAYSGVKLDNITAALGEAWEVVYYSNRFFTDAAGTTWKEIPTQDSDLLAIEGTTTYNAFIYQLMLNLQSELKREKMALPAAWYAERLFGGTRLVKTGLYERLRQKYLDQSINRQVDFYEFGELDGYGGDSAYEQNS